MDSASSLPLHAHGVGRLVSTSTAPGDQLLSAGQQGHPALMAGQATSDSRAAAAALLPAVAGQQAGSPDNDNLVAARYHNWEPQTSLLELGSTVQDTATHNPDRGSEQAQMAQQARVCAATGVQHSAALTGSHQPAAGSLTPASASSAAASGAAYSSQSLGAAQLGTWDAPMGGLWLSGSLAPVSGPGSLQGAVPSGGQQPGVVQQQHAAGEQGQAALQAGHLPEPLLSVQQYVQLRQQQFASQVQQQQQQQSQRLPVQQGHPARSTDASSSGAYLDQSSSFGLEGSTGVTDCSGVTDGTEGVEAGKPNVAL